MLKCSPTTNYCAIEITGENGRTEPTIILFIKYKKKIILPFKTQNLQ